VCGASAYSLTPAEDDPEGQTRMRAFVQGLQQLGRIGGRRTAL
jgi:hypothetical protein